MKQFHVIVCLMLSVLVGFSSCKKGEDYTNAIPQDAAVVLRVDLKSIATKSGLQTEAGQQAVKKIAAALKNDMQGTAQLIDKITEDPDECGLKLTDDVFLFIESGAVNGGLVARVSSSRKLASLIKEMNKEGLPAELRKEGGCSYAVMGPGIVAFTDKACVALVNLHGDDGSTLVHTAQMMLRQKQAESFSASPDFKELMAADGDMALIVSAAMLPSEISSLMTIGMPSDISLSAVKGMATVKFEQGMVVVDGKDLTTDKTILALRQKLQSTAKPVKGSFMGRFNANTFLWGCTGIDGKACFEMIKENPTLNQFLSSSMIPVDFEAIFSALQGDIFFAKPDMNNDAFIVLSEINDETFLKTFEDLKPILAMTGGRMVLLNDGEKGYCFRATDDSMIGVDELYFGVKDGCFYLTTDRSLVDFRAKGLSVADTSWGKQARTNRGAFGVNLSQTSRFSGRNAGLGGVSTGLQQLFGSLGGFSSDGKTLHIALEQKDKQHRLPEQLLQMVNGF